ncbi:unnamed protein product [Trifolium pratense]|uniref:Uncharacterized protein n=1 Tax=Trifolium pratense TaxID=57577 RepID=A0ACB0J0B3_TRIPR|nr:unnamed protein product [Trifolium pratense]
MKDSYAHAVRSGDASRMGDRQQTIVLSYEAEKNDLLRMHKAFIGVVVTTGMTYNIQKVFHAQGYFGVKATPLGSNLILLEGREDGEMEALMEDAKDSLNQWFKEIRPWNPKDVDVARLVWLHDVTSKKLTMDVARILIRTSCQKPVDEFFDVKVNGEIFHMRLIEDSNGPMRLNLPQPQGKDGRDSVRVLTEDEEDETEEEEEEEEDVRRMLTVADEFERESKGGGENLLALYYTVNANNTTLMEVDHVIVTIFLRETGEENSNHSINLDTNLNSGRVISENLNSKRGYVVLEGGEEMVDSLIVKDGKLMGREEGVGEPTFSVLPKQNVMRVTGRRGSTSVDLGQLHNSNNQLGCVSGDAGELRGGVYSDGPRAVYNKLNSGPSMTKTPQKKKENATTEGDVC